MNPSDEKLENRKDRLMLAVATMFAATPPNQRITQADVNTLIDAAFDLEARVMQRLGGQ